MSVKSPIQRDGLYTGLMPADKVKNILDIRQVSCVPNLKHMIFNFPYELVLQSILEGKSIRKMLKESGEDYSQYIGELRDYQTVGTAFMYLSPRSIIGDGVGLGKTAEIAALLNLMYQKKELNRFIMCVENSALGQTQAELTKFTGMNIVAMPSEAPKISKVIRNTDWDDVQGIIIKHSTLKSDALSGWLALNTSPDGKSNRIYNCFILDESSVIKNDKTKTYQYTLNLCNLSPRVHLMNATTFETNIMDIYYQVDMMDPTLLPRKWSIEKRFCTYERSSYWTKDKGGTAKINFRHTLSDYKNQEEFRNSLKAVYFGRCKADIGMDRPNIYKVYTVQPTNAQSLALTKGYRYPEVLNSPANVADLNLTNCRRNIPKLERLCQLLETDFQDSKVMVYCFHLAAQAAIKEELEKIGRKCVILNGGDKSSDKDANRLKIMNDFNNGVYDVIITNIKRSLNLYAGDVCIMYSMEANVSKATQILGRIDRNVDDKLKTFILLYYAGTDEEKLFLTKAKKREEASRALNIDAEGAISKFLSSMEYGEN